MTAAPTPVSHLPQPMLETAALWRQRMVAADRSAEDEAEFEAWLLADERHGDAFGRIGEVWDYFGQHTASPESLTVRRALLGRVQNQGRRRWATGARPARWLVGGAIAAALAIGVVWPLATQGDVYRTGVGERRVVILGDGSVLTLDALSRVSVRYSGDARRLELTRGQASFEVAHDPARPFRVAARDRTVVATGTAFNIDLVEPEVRVTLIEGRVLVLPRRQARIPLVERPALPAATVELRAGQGLVADPGGAPQVVANVDVDRATAWQKGKLVFDEEPLADAVERVNRYSERKISIADPDVAALRISGVFNVSDAHAFLDAVTGTMPVAASEEADGVVLRAARRG